MKEILFANQEDSITGIIYDGKNTKLILLCTDTAYVSQMILWLLKVNYFSR